MPQVPLVVAEAKRALSEGQSVVIGLQATGEAAADALSLEPGQPCGWVSVTREMLQRFVAQHFPTRYQSDGKGGARHWSRLLHHPPDGLLLRCRATEMMTHLSPLARHQYAKVEFCRCIVSCISCATSNCQI